MTDPVREQLFPASGDRAARIRAIAAGLAAAGVTTGTNGNHMTGLDVTATTCPPGRAKTEIMLDEDGYAEIRWFTNPAAPVDEVTAALSSVLGAVAATPSVLAPVPPIAAD
jgi:hypothetical protein